MKRYHIKLNEKLYAESEEAALKLAIPLAKVEEINPTSEGGAGGGSHRNLDELKIEWLINDTYQVVDERENVMKQGSINDCNNYLTDYYGG
jgi:hypothetical protein